MDYDEAQAWLRGERSMVNMIDRNLYDTWEVRIAQADAAMVCQSYWIVKAHKEGLVDEQEG